VVEQVGRDHALLRERISRLGGARGLARLDAALAAVRASARAPPASPASSLPDAAPGTPASPFLASPGRAAPRASSAPGAPGAPRRAGASSAALRRLDFGEPGAACKASEAPAEHSGGSAGQAAAGGGAPVADPSAGQGAAADAAGAAAPDASPNADMLWALLHDLRWQLPAAEAEALWADAAGETDVMAERCDVPEGASPAAAAAAVRLRVRRIAERAFWDGAAGAMLGGGAAGGGPAGAGPGGRGGGVGPGPARAAGAGEAAARMAALLAELGAQARQALPPGAARGGSGAALLAALDEARLREALLSAEARPPARRPAGPRSGRRAVRGRAQLVLLRDVRQRAREPARVPPVAVRAPRPPAHLGLRTPFGRQGAGRRSRGCGGAHQSCSAETLKEKDSL
jgi:hypothetical protein